MILDNPHYIGKVKWNTRKTAIVVEDGDIRKTRPRQEPELYDGKHEAIISNDLWEEVRRKRIDRHIPKVRSSFDLQNPLAGLIRCECGSVVIQTSPANRSRRLYCKNQSKCGNAGCATSIVLKMIADALRQELEDISVSDTEPDNSPQIEMLNNQIASLKSKQDALWEKYTEGMPKATFERLLAKNEEAIARAESALSAAEDAHAYSERRRLMTVNLHAALDALSAPETPPASANALLKACISRITYRRKRAVKALSGGNRGGWATFEPELTIEMKL